MPIRIETVKESRSKFEYNCNLRRILPWDDVPETIFGCAEATISPQESTKSHSHHYGEIFYITEGNGIMNISGFSKEVSKGDLIFIPADKEHFLTNSSQKKILKMICIWGDIIKKGSHNES